MSADISELGKVKLDDDHEDDLELEGNDEGDINFTGTTASISLDKNDRSLSEFYRWYQRRRLVVDPEWQRQYVWDKKRASRLIESFLIDLPVPVIYLAINEENKYEVIDGLQRLTSVFDFFQNKYPLVGLEICSNLNGKKFEQLSPEEQGKIEDTTIRTFELSHATPKDLMFIIFERLNTGGMALNDMEIRNCLYRGTLNDLIKELAKNEDFLGCLNQKGLQKRMKDRMLILRFLAFYQMTYSKARKGLKLFFNEFFNTYRNPPEAKIKEFQNVFKKSAKAAHTIFGDKGFRLRRQYEKGRQGGEWTPSINASVFQVIMVSFAEYDLGASTRNADNIYESYIDLISSDEKWAESVRTSTGDFLRIEYAFTQWYARLKAIMQVAVPNDSQRLFSRSLKEELFAQHNTCEICGQKIALINDSALDHDTQYWNGGQTVPTNARLVHRQCNLERSRSRAQTN
ncbi:MAG: GmrSD restriction endonuclease domain-containing protein [Pyrinomonadaceae bacterium]